MTVTATASVSYATLVERLRVAFGGSLPVAPRQQIPLQGADGPKGVLLIMPAWRPGGLICVKLSAVMPDNAARDLDTIQSTIVVLDATSGEFVAVLDGRELTRRRTAAASALAAEYLARTASQHLVLAGTGPQAIHLALAHCSTLPIRHVSVWGRSLDKAAAVVATLASRLDDCEVIVAESLEMAVRQADIVSCATSTAAPILLGRWLRPGTHVDLVGSFQPDRREADTEVLKIARIFVDAREDAMREAGDLLIPIAEGSIGPLDVEGDLHDLASGRIAGRAGDTEITVFKSVGCALEDLVAVELCLELNGAPAMKAGGLTALAGALARPHVQAPVSTG